MLTENMRTVAPGTVRDEREKISVPLLYPVSGVALVSPGIRWLGFN
jgi:hypothetical protein